MNILPLYTDTEGDRPRSLLDCRDLWQNYIASDGLTGAGEKRLLACTAAYIALYYILSTERSQERMICKQQMGSAML